MKKPVSSREVFPLDDRFFYVEGELSLLLFQLYLWLQMSHHFNQLSIKRFIR